MSAPQRSATISLMQRDGVRWLRLDYYPASSFDLAFISDAQAAGISVDALLEDFDASPQQFAVFAKAAVAKLQLLGVRTYEILNEVNLAKPPIDAKRYVGILQSAYRAIKNSDSSATVLMSGLGPGPKAHDPATYLSAMYDAGAKGFFDAANLHPYSFPDMPEPPTCPHYNAFCYGAPAMRAVMQRNGDADKSIWFTEFGCPTGTAGGVGKACTDATLAEQLRQAFDQSRAWGWVGKFMVFSWRDDALDGDFGLYTASGAPKPHVVSTYRKIAGVN